MEPEKSLLSTLRKSSIALPKKHKPLKKNKGSLLTAPTLKLETLSTSFRHKKLQKTRKKPLLTNQQPPTRAAKSS